MSIERDFDVPFIAALALREKAIQQNYRPIISVHKWFARRPGTLFRGLLLAEFAGPPLAERFFQPHQFSGLRIADPFMGGGTPLLEANRIGSDVIGWDINPMAWWIVSRGIEHLDLAVYEAAADRLLETLHSEVGRLYETTCTNCGDDAPAKYFLWVKTLPCSHCSATIDLFPGYLVARDVRHPLNVLVCAECGELNEVESRAEPGDCRTCASQLHRNGPARRGSIRCVHCGQENAFSSSESTPLAHRMFAIEYYCSRCKAGRKGRFFKKPDENDLRKYAEATERWSEINSRYVPDDTIPPGDESSRLHRWGYKRYRDLFNERQLLGLELSCRLIVSEQDERVRKALATNLSDLLRYNNMIVRYDTMALKALDIFSVHGFPVGLVRCESNLLGIRGRNGKVIGSGGWVNIVSKYLSAKAFCDQPFEVPPKAKRRIPIRGEWIGDRFNGEGTQQRGVDLRCESATKAWLDPNSLDGVFTDPPYYDSVQYAELMDFCYVWLRRIAEVEHSCFQARSTRSAQELTGNVTAGRTIAHFTDGLSAVYQRMSSALRPGAPFVFTYHHNRLEAYYPIAVAMLDAGLTCSAVLPCPAEMGGSIHISGTGSSILDSVFVCRTEGAVPETQLPNTSEGIAALVALDQAKLRAGGMEPSEGDTRCIIYGHLTRLAVWRLKDSWVASQPISRRLERIRTAVAELAALEDVLKLIQPVEPPQDIGAQPDLFVESDDEPQAVAFRSLVRGGTG